VKTTDEGRAAARRAEIRERLLQIAHRESLSDDITEDEFADVCRNIPWTIEETRELVATLREAADLLAECDRLSRAVEALTMIEMALDNYFSYSPSRRDEKALGALLTARKMAQKALASPAPAAEDGRTP
jgi:uncharacterized metal-binding protein YceD (DUF177 family)